MKFIVTAMVFFTMAAGCGSGADDARRPLPGGFSEVSARDGEVVEAAMFAVSEMENLGFTDAVLTEIVSAEQQVVAGMNYRLVLKVSSGGGIHYAGAQVWRRLSGEHELIALEPLE